MTSPGPTFIKRGYRSNDVVVNNKSSFKSHLVRCQNLIDNIYFNEIVIKGMGKATVRAANLAMQLNLNNYNCFEIITNTMYTEVYDEKHKKPLKGGDKDGFNPDAIDLKSVKPTKIPVIEIVVRKNKLEIEKTRQFRPTKKSEKSPHKENQLKV